MEKKIVGVRLTSPMRIPVSGKPRTYGPSAAVATTNWKRRTACDDRRLAVTRGQS